MRALSAATQHSEQRPSQRFRGASLENTAVLRTDTAARMRCTVSARNGAGCRQHGPPFRSPITRLVRHSDGSPAQTDDVAGFEWCSACLCGWSAGCNRWSSAVELRSRSSSPRSRISSRRSRLSSRRS